MTTSNSSAENGMTTGGWSGREEHVIYRFERSRELLDRLSDDLDRRTGRKFTQLARVCELVNLALTQVDDQENLGMAWILLEQARQQLGHAATGMMMVDAEASVWEQLVWCLQRDLMPWPDNAAIAVDFGGGPDLLPDFRPDTPLELASLQLLANSAMTFSAGEAVQDPENRVMAMAFGEYVWTIMNEAMELLEFYGDSVGDTGLGDLVSEGQQAADLIGGAFPPAWRVFHGPAGFPD